MAYVKELPTDQVSRNIDMPNIFDWPAMYLFGTGIMHSIICNGFLTEDEQKSRLVSAHPPYSQT